MAERLSPEAVEQVTHAFGQREGALILSSLLSGIEDAETLLGIADPLLDVVVEVFDKVEWARGIQARGGRYGIHVRLGAQASSQFLYDRVYPVGAHEAGHAFRAMTLGDDDDQLNAFHRTVHEGFAEHVKYTVLWGDNYAPEGALNLTEAQRKPYDEALVELICGDPILPDTHEAYLDFHRGETKYGNPYRVGRYLFAAYATYTGLSVPELASVGYAELENFAGTML
ncbi:MAG: hypothetical protein JWM81_720 [Candidatus Saccharibacteria bacterium]|nr:hypothetical protein [Candidatus Saccharibacteria bacterium]